MRLQTVVVYTHTPPQIYKTSEILYSTWIIDRKARKIWLENDGQHKDTHVSTCLKSPSDKLRECLAARERKWDEYARMSYEMDSLQDVQSLHI